MKVNPCQACGKPTRNIKFCSHKCSASRYIKRHSLVCQKCGRSFTHNNMYDIKRGKMKFCSEACRLRKYNIDDNYFNLPLDDEKRITLGQMLVVGEIVDWRTIKMFSSLEVLEDIRRKIGSEYSIDKSDKGLCRMTIRSVQMVCDLVELGMVKNGLYQDVPDDLWEGIKRTHCYGMDDGLNVFRSERSRISLWVSDKFGGEMVTRTYKDSYKGIMSCEWVVVWK